MKGAVKSGERLIEEGVGLIAQGMFRLGDRSTGNMPNRAAEAGFDAVSVIRALAFNFYRLSSDAAREQGDPRQVPRPSGGATAPGAKT